MAQKQEVICRYAGCDEYGNELLSEKTLKTHQEWCEKGITCNRPWIPTRDDFGLSELEQRHRLNFQLLQEWNTSLRSPYCQCTYSSGHPPTAGLCRTCKRPMNSQYANELDRLSEIDRKQHERIRRLNAGPTWIMVYENTVRAAELALRAAELALKLLINATGPAPEKELPKYGKHDLRALWNQVPKCAKDEVYIEIYANHHYEDPAHAITATGELISDPLSIAEQPVFDKFGEEFASVRYAWDDLVRKGLVKVKEMATKWPDPINLYYLYSATGVVLSVLQRHPWDSQNRSPRWARRVQLALGLDESTYHTDWPHKHISEEPNVLEVKPMRQTL